MLCFKELVEGGENITKHGTHKSVKYCSSSTELSFGRWTCSGFTDLPRRTESGPESGAPESFKVNTSFQAGEVEKKETEKMYLEVVFMTYAMSKAFKEDYS